MKYYSVKENKSFIGRKTELNLLGKVHSQKESAIVMVYGRRRVGKTELIEQFFRNEKILKFEGIQIDREKGSLTKQSAMQIAECVRLLGQYKEQESLFKNIKCDNWTDFFELLTPIVISGNIILYFDETQWLSCYGDEFLARMKPFWDNQWRHNAGLRIIFSGSSPSFLVSQFMSDKAMYNRSTNTIHLAPFSLHEIDLFLGKSGYREKLLAACAIGGIPEYLKKLKQAPSIYLGLLNESFSKNGFFVQEYSKIFVSSLSHTVHYKKAITVLAKQKFATRKELTEKLSQGKDLGGSFTRVLDDLESCGFVNSYTSLHLPEGRNLARLAIADEYLRFYHNFISPIEKKIRQGEYESDLRRAVNQSKFDAVLGLSFEFWCRKNHHIFAQLLRFDIVEYTAGPFFNRALNETSPGFQIDLIYIRKDAKIVIAEIKYGHIPKNIRREVSAKVDAFFSQNPKYKNHTIETLLISGQEKAEALAFQDSFDHIIGLEDLFSIRE